MLRQQQYVFQIKFNYALSYCFRYTSVSEVLDNGNKQEFKAPTRTMNDSNRTQLKVGQMETRTDSAISTHKPHGNDTYQALT